ncbi:hypothetical protein ACFJIU_23185 [Mesorhizobium sp. UC74_2]|uniref:hypothetical protein n=1 Tax=Mesorhizobium sp. UC74_2 TaxID=3350171 RepID=UPI003672F11B
MAIVMLLGTVLTLAIIVSISAEDRLQINTSELSRTLGAAIAYDADGHLTLDRQKLATNIIEFAEAQPAYWYVIDDGRQVISHGQQPAEVKRVFDQTPREIQYSEFRYRQDNHDMLGIRSVSRGDGPKIVSVGGIVLSNWETVLVALVPVRSQGLLPLFGAILLPPHRSPSSSSGARSQGRYNVSCDPPSGSMGCPMADAYRTPTHRAN